MVGCDTCDEWYHASCIGIDFLEVLKAGDAGYPFICEKCKKQADSKSKKPKLSKKIRDDLKKFSINAHNAIGCNCVSRVDFKYDQKRKKIFLLEINTQPGLTNNSLLPEMAKEKITFFELCEILINNPTCEKY